MAKKLAVALTRCSMHGVPACQLDDPVPDALLHSGCCTMMKVLATVQDASHRNKQKRSSVTVVERRYGASLWLQAHGGLMLRSAVHSTRSTVRSDRAAWSNVSCIRINCKEQD